MSVSNFRAATAVLAALASAGLLSSPASGLAAPDSDGDGMPNRWELRHDLNPHRANARRDADQDGLRNLGEYRHDTDPRMRTRTVTATTTATRSATTKAAPM